jgi:hypothetical protein
MDLDKWLDGNIDLNTESRVSMEQLVLSQEGFFDKAKDFIFGKLGKSMKGDDYKPVKLEHTYNFKSTITAISRQYGDTAWLSRQNWNRDKVEAGDIVPYLTDIEPGQLIGVLTEAADFTLAQHKAWLEGVTTYFQNMRPVVRAIESGLTDRNLQAALTLMRSIPEPSTYLRRESRIFPVGNRQIPVNFGMVKPPVAIPATLRPLNKKEVEAAVRLLVSRLEELVKVGDDIMRAGYAVVGGVATQQLIQLSHSKNPKMPKDSRRSLSEWVLLSRRLDVPITYWSCEDFAIVRRYFGDVVLASCRWIDRSIR